MVLAVAAEPPGSLAACSHPTRGRPHLYRGKTPIRGTEKRQRRLPDRAW